MPLRWLKLKLWIVPGLLALSGCSADALRGAGFFSPPDSAQVGSLTPTATPTSDADATLPSPTATPGPSATPSPTPTPTPSPTPSPARLEATPSIIDFMLKSVNAYASITVTLENTGDLPASLLQASPLADPFSFKGGTYPGQGGTCGTTVGQSPCTVVVTFHPTIISSFSSMELFSYNDGTGTAGVRNQTLSVMIRGSSSNVASLELCSGTGMMDLGNVEVGSSVEKLLPVVYAGAFPATGISVSGLSGQLAWSTDTTKTTCVSSTSKDCQVGVKLTATTVGMISQDLKISYNNSAYADQTVCTLKANILAAKTGPKLTIAPEVKYSSDFGKIPLGSSGDQVFRVTNGGSRPANKVKGSAFLSAAYQYKGGTYPGTGGTCTDTIASDCLLAVTFTPAATGTVNDKVGLDYQDGSSNAVLHSELAVTGAGVGLAKLSLASPCVTTYTFPATSVGMTASVTCTVSNVASGVTATSISFSALTAPFSLANNNCGATLNAGASCTFQAKFSPTAVVTSNGNLDISYFDSKTAQKLSLALVGDGAAAATVTTVATLDFGSVAVGSEKTLPLTFNVFGTETAKITKIENLTAPFSNAGGTFPGGGTCDPDALANGCTAKFTFKPTAAVSSSITVKISYTSASNSTEKTVQFILKGKGVITPVLTFEDGASYDFGSSPIGTPKEHIFKIKNSTSTAATVVGTPKLTAPFSFKGGNYPGTGGTCGTTISADCTVVAIYTPTKAQTDTSALAIDYNDGLAAKKVSINLSGTGTAIASLTVTVDAFGKVPVATSSDKVMVIANTGGLTATSVSIALSAAPSSPFSITANTCGTSLAGGANCQVTVRFSPVKPGSYPATLEASYVNGSTPMKATGAITARGTVAAEVHANGDHSCVKNDVAELKCWGHNNYGQLGIGRPGDVGDSTEAGHVMDGTNAPISLGTGRYVKSFATGFYHTCAILDNGAVKCWGWNGSGQLGLGDASSRGLAAAEMGDGLPEVALDGRAVVIAAGYAHTCAILESGAVKCWGANSQGQLGLGDTRTRGSLTREMGTDLPAVDLGGKKAIQLALDTGHTCVILEDKKVKCWGDNFYGQLGLGDTRNRGDMPNQMGDMLDAVDLGTGAKASQISAGGGFTCAMLDTGAVKCWGLNTSGNLGMLWCQDRDGRHGLCSDAAFPFSASGYGGGRDQMGDKLPAIALGTGRKAVALSSGNFHSCVILDNGDTKCWGRNEYGQLGLGDVSPRGMTAASMGDGLPALALGTGRKTMGISAGNMHSCAMLDDGSLKCWGDNRFGDLGIGDKQNRGDQAGEMEALPAVRY